MAKTMESGSPAAPQSRVAKNPTEEEIAVRAYQIYEERGGAAGNEVEDWIRAERELLAENVTPAPENEKPVAENGKARRKGTVKSASA